MNTSIFIFVLSAIQFYSIFLLSKFIDFSLHSSYTLLTIASLQLVSSWVPVKFNDHPKLSLFLTVLYPLSWLYLAQTDQNSNIPIILGCIFIIIVNVQLQIIKLLTNSVLRFEKAYALEMLGISFGIFLWYWNSRNLGFAHFLRIALFVQGLYWFKSYFPLRSIITFISFILAIALAREPSPALNKRQRYELVEKQNSLMRIWDPNGHVELVASPDGTSDNHYLLFEGGALRSHIFRFDGNYEKLKSDYNSSIPTGLWGLDVVLPHFHSPNKRNCALISAMGGQEILAARSYDCEKIYAVDINKSGQLIMHNEQFDFSGRLYSPPVSVVTSDGRYFIKNSTEKFDLIQIYSAHNASYSGAFGTRLQPSSLVTAEAFQDYSNQLTDDGILQITQPHFKKVLSTFQRAFSEDTELHKKMLVISRLRDQDNLISFYFKKKPWTESEIGRIRNWLNQDPSKKWLFRIDPLTQEPFSNQLNSPRQFASQPVTDDWPFLKVIKDPWDYLEFKISFWVAVSVLVLVAWALFRKSQIYESGFFFSGVTFSMSQSFVIYLFQKLSGNPALGLSLSSGLIAGCSLVGSVSAGQKRFSSPLLYIGFSALILFALSSWFFPAFIGLKIVCIGALITVQSYFLTAVLRLDLTEIPWRLWINAAGLFFGMIFFNVIFIQFGFPILQWVLVSTFICVFLIGTKFKL